MPALLPKKRNYFALLFSDGRLQAAQASGRGKLKNYVEKKLPSGLIERGEIKNPEGLKQALIEVLAAKKFKSKFTVVGLPEVRAFTRSFILPPLPAEELNDAIAWESESLLPFPLEKAYLDWMVLEKSQDWVRVLVVALPQDLVEAYAQLLEGLGYQPVAFEITSLSLARLVRQEKTAVMVIEVKVSEAVLVVVGPRGGIEVSSTLSFETENEISTEITATIKNLLSYYRKKIGDESDVHKVQKVLICGSQAKPELAKTIEKETGIASQLLATKDLNLASFASLAQKEVAAPIDEETINLIPPRIQGIYDRAFRVKEISLWLKLGLLTLLIVFTAYGIGAARLYFESKKIEGEIIEHQASISPEGSEIRQRAKLLNQRVKQIETLIGLRGGVLSLLNRTLEVAPEGITISHFAYDGDKDVILIDGVADLRQDLVTFKQALEKTGLFSRVYVPLSSLEREANAEFTVSLTSQKD
jgi:Tfp pilus assembly PilM family ATPase